MKRETSSIAAWILAMAMLSGAAAVSAQEAADEIKSLDVSVGVMRSGEIEIEQAFELTLSGEGIKRGPILSYLTVYKGPGGLILDHDMRVLEVLRNGAPEPYKTESAGGVTQIKIGSADVFLEEPEQRYTIRFTRKGDWVFRDGIASWAYDVTESFRKYKIHDLTFHFNLPEGVEISHYAPGLSGSESTGTGYQLSEAPGALTLQTTAPLRPDAFVFVNAAWRANSFSTQSQWLEVMKQHPRLPISGFSAIVLVSALICLLMRIVRNEKPRTSPAT